MADQQSIMNAFGVASAYSYTEILLNMVLAVCLGFVMSIVYRKTHKGLSYSQSFTLTILFVTLIVAIVMMVIGGSLARAFALVGALSIIRFRTVVKDTKDTAYVFAGLAVGMASGTSNYFLALSACCVITALAVLTHRYNFGALDKSEFILRFIFNQSNNDSTYLQALSNKTLKTRLLHLEPSGDGEQIKLAYDVMMKNGVAPESLIAELSKAEGVSEVVLVASKQNTSL